MFKTAISIRQTPTTLWTGQITQVRNHVKIYPWRFNRNVAESHLDNTRTPYTDKYNINEFKSSKRKLKEWQIVIPKDKDNRFNRYKWNEAYKSDPVEAKETAQSRLQRFQQSLKDRGPARETRPYDPPDDVLQKCLNVVESFATTSKLSAEDNLTDLMDINLNKHRSLKFELITKCMEVFQHDMPSSLLNEIEKVRDVVSFFMTPIKGVNTYTSMLANHDNLPINLSLIPEAHRFDSKTDQVWQGYTALPGVISKVPGLRASKKYPILNQEEFQWPDI